MKKAVICLTLLLACAAAATAGEERSEVDYYRQLAEEQLAEMQAEPEPPPAYVYDDDEPANFLAVAPQYIHSRDDGDGEDGGDSHANGAAVRATYSRALSECFSFSLLYEYAFMKTGEDGSTPGERERWDAHTVGIGGEFSLGAFGRIIPSITHSFERVRFDDAEDDNANTTSLTAWWEKDLAAGTNWLLTPYAGWQSRHADNDGDDTRDWTHFAAAGLKLGYRNGCFGLNLRAGLSHRLGSDDSRHNYGYGTRALSNGVVQYSHAADKDRTVGSVGAGVNYAIGANASVGLDYDGFFGKDTGAHAGTLSFGFSF